MFSTTALEEISLGNSVSLLAVNSLNSRGCEGNALPQSYSINSKPITQLKVLNNRHFSLQMNGRHCMCLQIQGGKKNYINGKLTNSRKEDVADLLVMVNNYHPSQKPNQMNQERFTVHQWRLDIYYSMLSLISVMNEQYSITSRSSYSIPFISHSHTLHTQREQDWLHILYISHAVCH